ncbi:MAG: YciI family protein [Candidatus Acidiferrales bacterium]
MKYILLMSGSKSGVDGYRAWPQRDRDAHMAVLHGIQSDLVESGEFVATQGLSGPADAKMVRGFKDGIPITDGVFPESKEFLLGYWIVDVATAERAYEIAARISAAAGPDGKPTNMPMEVRQFATYPERKPS